MLWDDATNLCRGNIRNVRVSEDFEILDSQLLDFVIPSLRGICSYFGQILRSSG